MNDKGKKITVVVLGSLVGIVIYLSFKLRNDEADEIMHNHYEVVGVITNVGQKTIDVSYSVNGMDHTYTQNKPYSGLLLGEEFYVMASKNNLNRAIVFYNKPVLDTAKYKFASVIPLDIAKLIIDRSELSFTYKVGSKEYVRIQKYEYGKHPNELQNLIVKYRVDTPEIGYLVEK